VFLVKSVTDEKFGSALFLKFIESICYSEKSTAPDAAKEQRALVCDTIRSVLDEAENVEYRDVVMRKVIAFFE
jgi:hypothetical protein